MWKAIAYWSGFGESDLFFWKDLIFKKVLKISAFKFTSMAKQIEPYEEDDFLLEDQQNSNEEQTIEEEDEAEEESSFKLRPRPARASLTHNAIKSELLKMKKQDSGEDNEENLSRSARKRNKRREKVLEERRASGGK